MSRLAATFRGSSAVRARTTHSSATRRARPARKLREIVVTKCASSSALNSLLRRAAPRVGGARCGTREGPRGPARCGSCEKQSVYANFVFFARGTGFTPSQVARVGSRAGGSREKQSVYANFVFRGGRLPREYEVCMRTWLFLRSRSPGRSALPARSSAQETAIRRELGGNPSCDAGPRAPHSVTFSRRGPVSVWRDEARAR